MPEISVIVPIYKVEPYLHRCVDSILAQTFTDFELILVDDGSPDNCGAICDAYAEKDQRVRVLHRENQGVSAARNAGIDWVFANSDSKYIGFVDSDDWVHPRFLELMYRGIKQYHVNISQCRFLKTDGTKEVPEVKDARRLITPTEHYRDYYSGSMCCKLFSRECWKQIRFPIGQVYGEDAAVWYKILLEAGSVALVDAVLYYYFQRKDSAMHSDWTPQYMARMDTWSEQLLYIKKHGDAELIDAATNWYCKIGKKEYRAIERSSVISDAEKKKYQAILRRKFRRILIRNNTAMQKNPKYRWFVRIAFPKLNWAYWTAHGVFAKTRRILKQ